MNVFKKAMENRKLLISLAAVFAVIALCVGVLLLPFQVLYPDSSGQKVYLLSDASKQYLQGVSEDVEIIYHSNGGKLGADRGLYRFIRSVASESKHISVRLENPEKTGSGAADQSIEIRSGERSETIVKTDLVSYYNASMGEMSIEEYAQILTMMQNMEDAETYQTYLTYYGPGTMYAFNRTERVVIAAIRMVLAERAPLLYAYGNGGYEVNSLLRAKLEESGYRVAVMRSLEQIPADCEGLYLETLTDLTVAEASVLSDYLGKGGKVFLTTSYTAYSMPNLESVLKPYGLELKGEQNYLCTVGTSESSSASVSMQFAASVGNHRITNGISSAVASYAHLISVKETEGVEHSELLITPGTAYLVTATQTPTTGNYPICVLAEKENSSVVWLSMPLDSTSNSLSGGGNFTLVKQSFDHFTGYTGSALAGITDAQIPSTYVSPTNGAVVFWLLAFVLVIPVTVVAVGVVRYYIRKKQK